jgi:hypothetical protein
MENIENDNNWAIKFFNKKTQVIAIISVGVTVGVFFGPFLYEIRKTQIKDEIIKARTAIDSLTTGIDSDTVNYRNWSVNHLHKVSFNAGLIPLLTISKYHIVEKMVIDGYTKWTKEVEANQGDILPIQVCYKNTGKVEEKNIRINIGYYSDSVKNIYFFYGKIIMGNTVYLCDTVRLHLKRDYPIGFVKYAQARDENLKIKTIDCKDLTSAYGYNIGNLKPNGSGRIVYFITDSR